MTRNWTQTESFFGETIFQRQISKNGQVVITVHSKAEADAFDANANRFFSGVELEDCEDRAVVHSFCAAWEYAMQFVKTR